MGYLSDKYPDKGWHYRLRLHSDTYVQLSVRLSNGEWKQLGQLAPEEGGEHRYLDGVYLDGVYLTKDGPYGPVNGPVSVAICHAEGEENPWFIATSEEKADYLTLRTCSRRMWTEELFGDLEVGDLEEGGFHLNRSRIYQPERLSRLVMALAWSWHLRGHTCGREHVGA